MGAAVPLLDGKVVAITAAGRGVSRAMVRRFVDEGAWVFTTDTSETALTNPVAAFGRNVSVVQSDGRSRKAIERLYQTVRTEAGRLDVLVVASAVVEPVTIPDAVPEHFGMTFNMDARSTFFMVQKAVPLLRDGAAIVLVEAAAYDTGRAQHTAHVAKTAALRSFAQAWATELKNRNIRVNCLSPGPSEVAMISGQVAHLETAHWPAMPFRSSVRPDDMAVVALLLASDDASPSTSVDLLSADGFSQL